MAPPLTLHRERSRPRSFSQAKYLLTISKQHKQPVDILGEGGVCGARLQGIDCRRRGHALASKRLVDFEKIDLVQTGGV
jgi:hypothetical protein